MGEMLKMRQDPMLDFDLINKLLNRHIPFTFIRFSDGEMEIIFNSKLVIEDGAVEWRGRRNPAGYPIFDSKTFFPERDQGFRACLIEAAEFCADNFYKGIRTRGDLGDRDKEKMIALNRGRAMA